MKEIGVQSLESAQDKEVWVVLQRSLIGKKPMQRKTAVALGLRKRGAQRKHVVNSTIIGMLKRIEHMIAIKIDGKS